MSQRLDIIARRILARDAGMFEVDLSRRAADISERVKNRRILAIGAAGSIGSNTVLVLSGFAPACIHVIDQNENALAELVRQIRSAAHPFAVEDFKTLPLDYGSTALRYFLASEKPYDLVLNFAAIKHVRSEKDPFSTLQMFDTNILKQARLLGWLADANFKGRYFSVSTDKAANPASMMGASKRIMEHIMFSDATTKGLTGPITAARFANVAFSNGSLLESFVNRMQRREPISCPRDISRFFVSLKESGQICCLAATLLDDRYICVPKLEPAKHLRLLTDILTEFLDAYGFEPEIHETVAAAHAALPSSTENGRWPVILTPPDTAGEKPYEEFVAAGETAEDVGLNSLNAIRYHPVNGKLITEMLEEVEALLRPTHPDAVIGKALNKSTFKKLIAKIEPEFARSHVEREKNLDERA